MCFCVNTEESTRWSTFWLRSTRSGKVTSSPFTLTQKHIWVQSFKMLKDLTALSWDNILQHSHFYCSLTASCLYGTFRVGKKKKKKTHYMGHGVTSGMSWLICPMRRWQQSVSVCSVCAEQRVNTPTFTSSLAVIISLLSSRRTDDLCLFDIMEVFMVTTHTLAVREVRPPVFQWNKMNGTHTPLKRLKRHVKFVAVHPRSEEFVGFLPLAQQSSTVFCKTLKGQW